MKSVFVLQHSYEEDGYDETKFIGVYSSEQTAKAAVDRLRLQNGFKDRPNDFHIEEYELDKDHWAEGFATITSIQVKNGNGWVTATAKELIDGTYKIVPNYYDGELGNEFQGGDVVRCEERTDEEGSELYAVELIRKESL